MPFCVKTPSKLNAFKTLFAGFLGVIFIICLCLGLTACKVTPRTRPTNLKPKIYLAGDSTVKSYDDNQFIAGWGQYLPYFLTEDIQVINRAEGGRSSRSFLNEGRLIAYENAKYSSKAIENDIQKGDFLLIQFGHNDDDTATSFDGERRVPLGTPDEKGVYPVTAGERVAASNSDYGTQYYPYGSGTFKWYLKQYIDFARAKGAIPVLITPVSRVKYSGNEIIGGNGRFGDDFAYIKAVRQLAEEENCLIIDLFAQTKAILEAVGKDCGNYLMALKPNSLTGNWAEDYDALYGTTEGIEGTHYNKYGAFITAAKVAEAVKESADKKEVKKNNEYYTFADFVLKTPSAEIAPPSLLGDAAEAKILNLFTSVSPSKFDKVVTAFDYAAAKEILGGTGSSHKQSGDTVYGRFTVAGSKAYLNDDTSLNTQGCDISFDLNGESNSLSFKITSKTSSADCTPSLVKVVDGKQQLVIEWDAIAKGDKAQYSIAIADLAAGSYILKTSKSAAIAGLCITEKVEKSEAVGITVSGAKNKFFVGEEFSSDGLQVTLTYKNGRKELLSDGYTVNSSAFKKGTSGKYSITVSYGKFTAKYDTFVYAAKSLTVYDYSLNSSRVTLPVQKVFKVGDSFNSDNLAVHMVGKCAQADGEQTFILTAAQYSVSQPDLSTAGEKTVTVSAFGKSAQYKVYALNLGGVDASAATVKVDAGEAVSVSSNEITVKTINDAVRVFKLLDTPSSAVKNISVAAGEYFEKVEIDLPNVRITGAGKDNTTVVFDALNGKTDPSGAVQYFTDGSATVSVRAAATGFSAENICFKNYYCTHERYTEAKEFTDGTQAVAVLVQADKCVFKSVKFTSYQDTLYDMYGRHIYENCEIEGRTDYIFGYNSTAYFKGCTLKTIYGASKTNGGYVVSTKGCSKGEEDSIAYGYIFDGCTFIAESGVEAGSVSLARGWAEFMTVAFINCDMSAAYSKEAYGNIQSAKNDRYGKMNADPDATRLFEYGNVGEGALDYSQSGLIENTCTVLTAAQAEKYCNLSIIFAATNGNLTYSDSWNITL